MAEIPLPKKSVPLSAEGFAEVYETLRSDRAVSNRVADELEADTRKVLEHIFSMTAHQERFIRTVSDDTLRKYTKSLVTELRSDAPGMVELRPIAAGPAIAPGAPVVPWHPWGGSCNGNIVVINLSPPSPPAPS